MPSSHDGQNGLSNPSGFVERRRYPRHRPGAEIVLAMPVVVHAEVLDISAGGALISTTARVNPGQRGLLHTLLEREPFAASVEVLRVEDGSHHGGERRTRLGVSFASLDDNSRKNLQRFVKNDGKPR